MSSRRYFTHNVMEKVLQMEEVSSLLTKFGLRLYTGAEMYQLAEEDPSVLKSLTDICKDSIGMIYKVDNIGDGVFGISEKDVIVIGKTGTSFKSHKAFSDSLKGVLVAQRGECAKIPTVISLNLICTKQEKGLPYGSILVALFVIIGKLKQEKELILETANGYENLPAMCLYNRFGFQEDLDMLDPETCFSSANNVPMKIDLTKITLGNLKDILARRDGTPDFSSSICKLYSTIGMTKTKAKVTQAKRKLTLEVNKKRQEVSEKANEKLSGKKKITKRRQSTRLKSTDKTQKEKPRSKTRSISSRRRNKLSVSMKNTKT